MSSFTSSLPHLKRKFKLTALQITALFILPLFVFALIVKVKERKESENSIDKIVSTKNSHPNPYKIQTVSQPVLYESEKLENSAAAK